MEKLANHLALQSIAEGGMEKRALNAAQLLRMGRNFALRGKMDRFNKLMDRRAQAAVSSKVLNSRTQAYSDALDEYKSTKDYLLDGDASPALNKLHSAEKRLPNNPILIAPGTVSPQERAVFDADVKNDLSRILNYSLDKRNNLLGQSPAYDSVQLATFNRALRQLDPELHRKVLTTGSF